MLSNTDKLFINCVGLLQSVEGHREFYAKTVDNSLDSISGLLSGTE